MSKLSVKIFLAIIFVSAIALAQEKVYVPLFLCNGCEASSSYSAAYVFADIVNKTGYFEATLAEVRDSTAGPETFNLARESAELMSTKYFVYGEINKLEGLYYINVALYATSSGLKFWSDSKQTTHPEDIPMIFKEMASRMGRESKWSQPGDIELVSKAGGQKLNRLRSNKSLGVITGAMLPLSEKKINHINSGFGGLLAFDLRNFIIESSLEIYFAKDSLYDGYSYADVSNRYYNIHINTIYPLATTNSAPFACLGGGFSYRESEFTRITSFPGYPLEDKFYDHGFMFTGGGGYMLKRNSDAALFIYGRGYAFIRDFDTMIYGVMLNLALHFEP